MEKFQIELVVELIDKELKYCEGNLKRYRKTVTVRNEDTLFYNQKMEELEARIKNLKVIRNLIIYGE